MASFRLLARRILSPNQHLRIASRGFSTQWGADGKIMPHGGRLVSKMRNASEASAAQSACNSQIELSERQLCDVELLSNGAFSPLDGFMNSDAYNSVVDSHRLPDGLLFGLPVVLDVDHTRDDIKPGSRVALNYKGQFVGTLDVESRFEPNKAKETKMCYGTSSLEHPGTRMVAMERGHHYLGGPITAFKQVDRIFPCAPPAAVRADLPTETDVVAFQCRNPVHRAHYELFTRALDASNVRKGGIVLVHPTCGPTQEDDIDGALRYKTYVVLEAETRNPRTMWRYLPYSMHMAGPREALQHMIIRKNYGCTHFIIGRDMAGSKSNLDGEDFYGPYDAQDFAASLAPELGMQTVPSLNLVYTAEEGYITADQAKDKGLVPLKLSGTEFRRKLRAGEDIPEWFAFKSVVEVLRADVQNDN